MIDIENKSLEYFEIFKKKKNAKRYQEDCNDYELKEKIRDDLMLKQRFQCAYCERSISKNNSHIEHIEPRDKNYKLECEYSNLVLSCDSSESCGKYKNSKSWQNRFIHPVLNHPTEFFRFSLNGDILSENNDAEDTIKFLNLNNKKLIRLRKNIVLSINNMENIENITQYFNEFENLIISHRKL